MLRVTFLGTAGAIPTTVRNPSAVLVNRDGRRLLFDAGEGTQRQMMRFGTGFGVSDLFVTHLHGDHVLGIPGLVQTWDFNDRTEPLTIHAPRGTSEELDRLVRAGGYVPGFPISIDEVAEGETAVSTDEFTIEAFRTDHDTRSVGYVLQERDRKGRFDRQRAEELGVPVGPKFSALHDGDPVTLDDGTVIRPDQVVGDPRPGRRLVYTGDTRPIADVVMAARDADLLIHEATFSSEYADRAQATGHSTAAQAAELANRANAKRLVLTHLSSRYADDVDALEREASAVFDGSVVVAEDGTEFEVPFPTA